MKGKDLMPLKKWYLVSGLDEETQLSVESTTKLRVCFPGKRDIEIGTNTDGHLCITGLNSLVAINPRAANSFIVTPFSLTDRG